jgi:sugar phosphate isomerase/epimerase
VKAKLKDAGVRVMNYGVVDLPKDEAQSRIVFEFAKDMGIETIVSEPKEDAWDTVEKLVKEYGIKVAIHDHPKPSRYWNPDHVLEVIKGRDPRIGACADTGHWPRSGLSALDSMKKLDGHIISFHFKDLNEFGKKEAHDVPWGTGVSDAKGMLEEAKRQNFKGVFSIEYETSTGQELIDNVKKCIEFFDATANELAK